MSYSIETSKHILQQEIDVVLKDIETMYEESGKRTTGEFLEGLEAKYDGLSVEIWGYGYLAGRPKGKMPPVAAIEKWVIDKGITPIEKSMTTSTLAYLIARKIAREGTADESHLPIYEKVLTPERMDSIIKKVSEFHAQQFVIDVTVQIKAITQKYTK